MATTEYQVLAPLPWLASQWSLLMERHQQERLPHAILFTGVAGVGKSHLARLLGASLLCQRPVSNLPCGKCHACSMLAAGSHPDMFIASPGFGEEAGGSEGDEGPSRSRKSKSKTAKPSRQIKMDCIHALIEFTHHASHQGGRRVIILEPAEAMNISAANALLKTLEEPGQGIHIILVAHQASRLLATVRSRCQVWLCPVPPVDIAESWLATHVSKERARFALQITGGAPLRALQAIEAGDDVSCQSLHQTLRAVQEGQTGWLEAGESVAQIDPLRVVEWWWLYLHQQCRQMPHAPDLAFADQLTMAYRRLQGTANPNPRLLLESLLIDWAELRA